MITLILIFDYGTERMYVTYEIKGPSYCQTLFGYLKYQYLSTKLFFYDTLNDNIVFGDTLLYIEVTLPE